MRRILIAVLACICLMPTDAVAGEYEVQQCHSETGFHVAQGWNFAADGTYGGAITGCTGGGYFQLNGTQAGGVNWLMLHTPILPGALTFSSARFNYFAQGPTDPAGASVRFCAYNNVVAGMCNAGYWDDVAYAAGATPGGKVVGCATVGANLCKELQFILTLNGGVGHFWFGNVALTVNDPNNPSVATPSGGSLKTSANTAGRAWNNVSRTVTVGGSDAESGIKGVSAYVDKPTHGATVFSPVACAEGPYAEFQPCPSAHSTGSSIVTTAYSDGPHTLFTAATDAGGNTATSTVSFYSDNVKPATPAGIEPHGAGLHGWSNVNSFDVDWSNSGETVEDEFHSGIDKVVVDLNPTESGQTDPAPVTIPVDTTVAGITATRSSLSGLSLPAAGAWTLRLKLVDKAGNESAVGDGTGGSADSDIEIGYDPATPNAPNGQQNGWISRDELAAGYDQDFTYTASFNAKAPICGFASTIDKDINGVAGTGINVAGGGAVRKFRLPGTLDEATHYVHLRGVSCNGTASPTTNTTEAKVDRTDPVGTITGVENGRWYKDGQAVTLSGTDALSGMAPADSSQSDSRFGAYLAYSINGTGPDDINAPRGDSTTIPVTGEGSKELRFSPVDLAGNKAVPKVVSFGIDATNPTGYIYNQDKSHPTLLSASLGDVPSGVSYAIFSVRAAGSYGSWLDLPTSLTGVDGNAVGIAVNSGAATARFPDTDLPSGTYDVRVRAFDQAGNELYTNKLKNGSIAQLENPMRDVTSASVTLSKAVRECKRVKNGKMKCTIKKCPTGKKAKKFKGTCYKIRKGKVVLTGAGNTVTTEYNRGAIALGTLADASGKPLANSSVEVTTTDKTTGTVRTVGTTTTDSKGIYAIRVPAGVNKSVKASFDGSELRRPTSTTGTMNSKAKLTLKVPKKAKTGQTITFSGKITSYDAKYPTGGKIAALQFFAAKKWRPAVAVSHTDSKGRFKIRYKFDGRPVRARIVFRVVAPFEGGWGHVYSASKPKVVFLNF